MGWKRRIGKLSLAALLCAVAFGALAFWASNEFFVHQAEKSVHNLLLSQRGLHLYIQRVLHPTLYRLKDERELPQDFYSPELFSSSFMVREQHALYNQVRRDSGLPEVYYKMASHNPRNPVNRADPEEEALIRFFNAHREEKSHHEIVVQDGKRYLYYATPFLETNEACLRCHGDRSQAPKQLQARYPGQGGFGEHTGEIRAIESIRVPIDTESRWALATTVALLVGALAFVGMGSANRWLRREVRSRTRTLQEETAERQKVEEALRFTQSAVDSMADALYWVRRDGSLRYVNDAACRALGYSRDELLALRIWDVDPSLAAWNECWDRFRTRSSGPTTHRRKDGTTFPVEVATTPTRFGGEECLWSVARDLTQRRALEAQLAQAQKMEAIGTLAGGIAHDFNNLLSAIIGYADLTASGLPSTSEERENVQEILRAGEQARSLVRQILAFSRKDQRVITPLQVGVLAKEALKLLRATLPPTIEVRQAVDAEVWALADPTGFHQILMNLGTNAFHAMRDRGGVLDVTVAPVTDPDGEWVLLRVRDTGTGMDEATRERIFEPYFTTKPASEGTGLGLPVVHGIVSSYRGTIRVESAPGRGSTFEVRLPRASPPATQAKASGPQVRGQEHILLVDDEETVRHVASRLLGGLGYRVTTADGCQQALELFRGSPHAIDVVLTDHTMPGMTGLKLAEELRKLRPDLPVALMTGYAEVVQGRSAAQLGVDALLFKPFGQTEVGAAIRSALGGRQPQAPVPAGSGGG